MIPIIESPNISDEISRLHRGDTNSVDFDLTQRVAEIGREIQANGDDALIAFTNRFDSSAVTSATLKVQRAEIEAAYAAVTPEFVSAFKNAIENIRWFHSHQTPKNWNGIAPNGAEMGFRYTPIETVGLYVPGGRAIYPSSVAMNAIPAQLAGVTRVVMVSPPQPDGTLASEVLVAADLCGVSEIYKIGGAQAIFALALGTKSIPKVDKIVGPGNKFVTLAKQQVLGLVAIDKPAGPSEVAIYLDSESEAKFAAGDMLAQLEHDPDAVAVSVSPNLKALEAVNREFSIQISKCSRQEILEKSKQNARLFHVKSEPEAIEILNLIASEHVVIMGQNPKRIYDQVTQGGAFFLGPYSPVTIGDYIAGTNHVLPTAGAARFSSPLGVMDFLKNSSVVTFSKDQLNQVRDEIGVLTRVEGLDAHRLNVEVRYEN